MEKAVYETTIWYTGNLVGYISVNSMDVPRIMNMFEESNFLRIVPRFTIYKNSFYKNHEADCAPKIV